MVFQKQAKETITSCSRLYSLSYDNCFVSCFQLLQHCSCDRERHSFIDTVVYCRSSLNFLDPTITIRELPRRDFGDPPPPPPLEIDQNYLLVFYSQLLKRVPVVLCLGALTGPRESPPPPPPLEIDQNSLILDFNCQPLRRVLICFMSLGPLRARGSFWLSILGMR